MADIERIEDERIDRLLEQLVKERTLIKIRLPDQDYTQLTMVLDLERSGEEKYFSIDLTEELADLFASQKVGRLIFGFTGPDQVAYRFTTSDTLLAPGKVLVRFPRRIERIQQRNNFRIKTQSDTWAVFTVDGRRYRLQVDNISLGGLYGIATASLPPLEVGRTIEAMVVDFPVDRQVEQIGIAKADIVRVEKRKGRQLAYAMAFIQIDRNQRQKLTRQIYNLQRAYLRKRLKVQ